MLEHFNSLVGGLPAPLVYGIIAALVFGEAALFFGFVLPGETGIIVGGVLAAQGKLSLPVLLIVAIVAAIVGDSVGYEIGRRYGLRLLDTRVMRRHRGNVMKAQDLIRRRGAFAVFIGRFTALLRALMPALVGSARLPYGRFLTFNAIGGVTWVLIFTLGGYVAGTAFEKIAHMLSRGLAVALAVVIVVALTVWSVRKHRRAHAAEPVAEPGVAEAQVAEAGATEAGATGAEVVTEAEVVSEAAGVVAEAELAAELEGAMEPSAVRAARINGRAGT